MEDIFTDNEYLCVLRQIKRGEIFFLDEEIIKVKDGWFLHKCGEELGNAEWFSRIAIPTPFHLSVQRDYTRLRSTYEIYADCTDPGDIAVFISTPLVLKYLAKL